MLTTTTARLSVALVTITLLAAACQSEPQTVAGGAADRATESPSAGNGSGAAAVGDPITLNGSENGLELRVTVLEVADPAPPPDFAEPKKGNRFVGIRVRLTNVGSVAYDDSPANGAFVIGANDQQYGASPFDEVTPGLDSPVVRPGDKRAGFITFELPKGVKLRAFQLTLDSGFGPETGEWKIGD